MAVAFPRSYIGPGPPLHGGRVSSGLSDLLQSTLGAAYRLQHELGGGGMARVFVAETDGPQRIVVKVLSPDLTPGVSGERFKREIRLAEQLHHANIVPVLSAGNAAGILYFTMPLIEGETLRSYMDHERQLSLDRVIAITRDVASALEYAHAQNVVHRDIKPENILLEHATGTAFVTDFGIARAIEKAVDVESVTSTGLTLGTPTYMSPEQAGAERYIDGRSDVYSFACVVYEMLVGTPPFIGPSVQAILSRHMSETPRSLRSMRRDLPRHVDDAVQRALAKMPSERFGSAGEFARAIEGHGSGDAGTVAGRSRRSTLAWAVTLTVCAALAALFALSRLG